MKINQHITIVRSNTLGLSSMSQVSCDAIYKVLTKHYALVTVTIVNDFTDLEKLAELKPDLAFLGMKFVPADILLADPTANNIWLADYLESRGIMCTGSGSAAHRLELDKPTAKRRVLSQGISTAPYYEIKQGVELREGATEFSYPLFIKPTDRGGGMGVDSGSVAHNFAQLKSKVDSLAMDLGANSLVEEYLPGREFSVAILKNSEILEYSIMPVELVAPAGEQGERILSAQVKSDDTERFMRISDEAMESSVKALALDVFHAIGARDYGRIDIRLNKLGLPQFLEANLIPSLIEGFGNFPKACLLHLGKDYETMILDIVQLGFAHDAYVDDIAPYEVAEVA